MLGFTGNATLPPGWFESNMRYDPVKLFSLMSYTIIALSSLNIFFYTNMGKLPKLKNKWLSMFSNNVTSTQVTAPPEDEKATDTEKIKKSKSLILGAGQTLIVTGITFALFVPLAAVRYISRHNLEAINSGNGRAWVYISRVAFPTIYQLVFPLFIILKNVKMRQSLFRNFKESFFWKIILNFLNLAKKE